MRLSLVLPAIGSVRPHQPVRHDQRHGRALAGAAGAHGGNAGTRRAHLVGRRRRRRLPRASSARLAVERRGRELAAARRPARHGTPGRLHPGTRLGPDPEPAPCQPFSHAQQFISLYLDWQSNTGSELPLTRWYSERLPVQRSRRWDCPRARDRARQAERRHALRRRPRIPKERSSWPCAGEPNAGGRQRTPSRDDAPSASPPAGSTHDLRDFPRRAAGTLGSRRYGDCSM